MSGFGGFTPEAYQQLQDAYNQQLSQADEVESAGVKIGSDTLGVETAPFKADWLDKTGLWKYPDGKGDYLDAKQTQENLLAALQSDGGTEDEEIDFDNLSDEELLEAIESILSEDGDDDDDSTALDSLDEDDDEEEDEDDELTDEELENLINELLSESEDSEEEDDDLDLDELEALVSEILGETEEAEDDDVISIADKIAALKEELSQLSAGIEPEVEPTDTLEETDSEENLIEEEEVTSDDESA